jgi:hypothetical protein
MYAGSYDFIAEQEELYGTDYVNSMLDRGYEPTYIPGMGWRWLLVGLKALTTVSH